MQADRLERYAQRRAELSRLSDAELKERFWARCAEVVAPMLELARTHTSPSIERAVLLRMGVDSMSAHGVVDRIHRAGLLGKGAGHVLLRLQERRGFGDVRQAAEAVLADEKILTGLFE